MMDMNKMLQNADWKIWMVVQVWFHKMLISFFTYFFQSEACGGKFQVEIAEKVAKFSS